MNAIEQYLQDEGTNSRVASRIVEKLKKHSDITEELIATIESKNFPETGALNVEGYTASRIHEIAPFMNLVGVYAFLIDLREDPNRAKEIIRKGFPRK